MDKMVLDGLPAPAVEYINGLENKLDQMQTRLDQLTEMLLLAQKSRFGSSSEQAKHILDDNYLQETLFNEAEVYANEDDPEPVIVEKHERKKKRTKEELAKDLPVKEVIIDLPEGERVCDICEGDLKPLGREFVRRELCIIPAQAYVTETYRMNYSCADCLEETDDANIIKPEVPVAVVKRGLASPSSAAHTMYQKFVNSMPLYRQSKDWATFGVQISRATLANWIIYTSDKWLFPLWKAMKALLLQSKVIMADETTVQVLKEPGKTPQSKSQMWAYCTGDLENNLPIVVFEYQPSRSGDHPKEFLRDAKDYYLLTDGYKGYNSVENVTRCTCWQHMRRKFTDAIPKDAPKTNKARIGLEFCQKLFVLEQKFETMTSHERHEQRLIHSKPILDEFFKWVELTAPLANSKFGEAIVYAINQKETLSAFLLNGGIAISTNYLENKIRLFAVGRKNWLFSDTVRGAKSSAVAYSIVQTAIANGLNPYQYLLHLFSVLPTAITNNPDADLSEYMPWAQYVQESCKYANAAQGQLSLLG